MNKKLLFFMLILTGCHLGLNAQEKSGPIFECGFESKKEIKALKGRFSYRQDSLVSGIKGKALRIPKGYGCFFPAEASISPKAGTLSAWIKTEWTLRDIKNQRLRLFSVINKTQKEKPAYKFNYFSILALSYGNIKKGIPYQLYTLARKNDKEQALLLLPGAKWKANTWQHIVVSWRIGTERKDGELIFYLNGKMLERKTDFRAVKINLGKNLACSIDGTIDELKTWNRILSPEEIISEYKKNTP
jgi:Concanavalin A-like lectin/glucanases superfamily